MTRKLTPEEAKESSTADPLHILKPYVGKIRTRDFLVYDFEWYAGELADELGIVPYTFRLGASYDGETYRDFSTVRDFVRGHLLPCYSGYLFFAHWAGIADHLYVIREIYEWASASPKTREVRIAMNASAAMILHCSEVVEYRGKKGETKKRKDQWSFVDSSFLFRVALSKIAAWFTGDKKGGDDGTTWKDKDDEKVRKYCRLDCKILFDALTKFQSVLKEKLGSPMGLTMASTAMGVMRHRFLKSDIVTPESVCKKAALGYTASRVEVYSQWMPYGHGYDINSSFPYAMTFPLPGSPIGSEHPRHLPKEGKGLYMADVEVTVPDTYLPPLPYRVDDRVFFPVGRWRSWYSSVDIELALAHGCEVRVMGEVVRFEVRHELNGFASELFAMRADAKKRGSAYEEQALKLILNSGYGKYSERELKEEFCINPEFTWCQDHYGPEGQCRTHDSLDCEWCSKICQCFEQYTPGIWRRKMQKTLAHRHVQIAMFITSYARRTLFLGQLPNIDHLAMSDTDSMKCGKKIAKGGATNIGNALGAWKYEGIHKNMIFLAPKLYAGQRAGNDPILHAKGFSIGKEVRAFQGSAWARDMQPPENTKRFFDATQGRVIDVDHMVRARGYLRDLAVIPYDLPIKKRVRLERQRPKRCYLEDSYKSVDIDLGSGSTEAFRLATASRPWNISEIHQEWAPS